MAIQRSVDVRVYLYPLASFWSDEMKRAMAGLAMSMGMAAWVPGAHAEVLGTGASFPSKVYANWADQYKKVAGVTVTYKPTGSGDGVKQITDRKVGFAGSDTPLSQDELVKRQLLQFPMIVGGIVPVVHLTADAARPLQLDGPTLAAIMLGQIQRWDDPRIAALNKGVRLPALLIKRIVRADKSGTSEGFSRYLSLVSPEFKTQVGESQLPKWPGPVSTAESTDGMVHALRTTPGAIAYVSFDRIGRDGLAGVMLRNASGRFVKASEAGFRAAIQESELGRSGNDLASLMDRPGAQAWPITSATFALIDANPKEANSAAPTLKFLYWCFVHGDELTRGTGFAPLPVVVQSRISARFASVKAQDQQPVHYMKF